MAKLSLLSMVHSYMSSGDHHSYKWYWWHISHCYC